MEENQILERERQRLGNDKNAEPRAPLSLIFQSLVWALGFLSGKFSNLVQQSWNNMGSTH